MLTNTQLEIVTKKLEELPTVVDDVERDEHFRPSRKPEAYLAEGFVSLLSFAGPLSPLVLF